MTLYFENETDAEFPFDCEEIAKKVIAQTLDFAQCPYEAEASLTLMANGEIRKINKEQRGIDTATDVLSFPMTEYPAPGAFAFLADAQDCFNPESGELMLGDIVISVERVFSQAEEYGHSLLREYAFLIAHSALHLIGFDHMQPEEAKVMEKAQEEILNRLQITRDIQNTERGAI